jgi:hypothetical protein
MVHRYHRVFAVVLVLCCTGSRLVHGQTVVAIGAIKDNTLVENAGGLLSDGAGQYFFVGRTGQSGGASIRRGVIAFDVAGNIPAAATITNVTLTLSMSKTTAGAQTVALHRALADWGEGTSVGQGGGGGQGGPSTPGDATWIHTFYDDSLWATAGGDFSATPSATQSVSGLGFYTWGSTAGMVADVQSWLDSPSTNYGWVVKGNEGAARTAKRFDSRQNSNTNARPTLTITYTPPAPAAPAALAATDITSSSFTANWNLVLGAVDYRLDVSADSTFSSFVTGYNNRTVAASSESVTGLSSSTTYYYRVRAVNSGGTSGNSNTISVTTSPGPPVAPTLLLPADSAIVAADSVTFTWEHPGPVLAYWFEIATDSTFTTSMIDSTLNTPTKTVHSLVDGQRYWWRVRARTTEWGAFSFIRTLRIVITNVTDTRTLPEFFRLEQNFPNPFNPSTVIRFSLSSTKYVTLKLYGVTGEEIETLVNGVKPSGTHEVEWNAAGFASGIYIVRLSTDESQAARKMILMK